MPPNEKYQQVEKFISKGELGKVFNQLPALLPPDSSLVSDLIVLEGQFFRNKQDKIRGVIKNDAFELTQRQLSQSLLAVIKQLKSAVDQAAHGQAVLSDTIRHIRALLTKPGGISHVFSRLEVLIEERSPALMPLLTPRWAEFNKNQDDFSITGIIDKDTYDRALRNIVKALTELMLKLEQEEAKIKGQGVKLDGEFAIFNCDRKKILRRFLRTFEEHENQAIAQHFYLLAHQQYGQSESIVKRLITHLQQQFPRVKYNGFHNIAIQGIDIEDGDDIEDGKYSLRKGFNRGLRPEVPNITALLEKTDQHYTQFHSFDYLPFVLQVNTSTHNWEKTGRPLIEWFAKTFCQCDKRRSKIPVFFIIIKLKDAKTSPQKEAPRWRSLFAQKKKIAEPATKSSWDRLEQLHQNLPSHCTLLPPLMRVVEDDLHDWYSSFENNERRREEKVKGMIQQLGQNTEGWHMADVENLLQQVIEEQLNEEHNI